MGVKHDTSFCNVNPLDYKINSNDPASAIIEFPNMHKRDKKLLENTFQDFFVEISQAAPTPPKPSPPAEFPCEVCGSIFGNSKLLRKHVKELDHRKWKQDLANKNP